MRDDRERLLDIQEAVERIERYAARGRKAFEQDELIQTWVLYTCKLSAKPRAHSRPNSLRNTRKSRGRGLSA